MCIIAMSIDTTKTKASDPWETGQGLSFMWTRREGGKASFLWSKYKCLLGICVFENQQLHLPPPECCSSTETFYGVSPSRPSHRAVQNKHAEVTGVCVWGGTGCSISLFSLHPTPSFPYMCLCVCPSFISRFQLGFHSQAA